MIICPIFSFSSCRFTVHRLLATTTTYANRKHYACKL